MAGRFRVTYDIVTEESAEDGDSADSGFVLPGEWHIDIETAMADKAGDYGMILKDAIDLCCPSEDCGFWFAESDARINYRTGENETRSLHPPRTITRASYSRLRRLLSIR